MPQCITEESLTIIRLCIKRKPFFPLRVYHSTKNVKNWIQGLKANQTNETNQDVFLSTLYWITSLPHATAPPKINHWQVTEGWGFFSKNPFLLLFPTAVGCLKPSTSFAPVSVFLITLLFSSHDTNALSQYSEKPGQIVGLILFCHRIYQTVSGLSFHILSYWCLLAWIKRRRLETVDHFMRQFHLWFLCLHLPNYCQFWFSGVDIKPSKIANQQLESHHMAVSLISGHEIMTFLKVPMKVLLNNPEGPYLTLYFLFSAIGRLKLGRLVNPITVPVSLQEL